MAHIHPNPNDPGMTRRLGIVLALTASYTVAEVVGGLWTGSLALLADAGHMMTDNMALILALVAAHFARRPPDPHRTYGYQRAEILAALVNGVSLVVICVYIFWEAWQRFRSPRGVDAPVMAAVAVGGLVVNLIAARLLHSPRQGLNVRGAYLHVLGDLLGSLGVLAAAALMLGFGWQWADPAVSVLIGIIIIVSSIRLVLDSVQVLMEGAPAGTDAEAIRQALSRLPGVCDVHDLHVWSLGGQAPLLTVHLVVEHDVVPSETLRSATAELERQFGITHSTLQIEPPDFNIIDRLSGDES